MILGFLPRRGYLFVGKESSLLLFHCPNRGYLPFSFIPMANSYTQLYIHFVFAVKYRQAIIDSSWRAELHRYITGIVQNNQHKLLAINSVTDHLHLFVGLYPAQSISELMRLVKGDSSEFINKKCFTKRKFSWQEGYGAFSNSRSQVDGVVKYIMNQEEHHCKKTFREEYLKMLNDYGVHHEERYVFQALQDD
jgi:putative transposase